MRRDDLMRPDLFSEGLLLLVAVAIVAAFVTVAVVALTRAAALQ
jgi:hypothetical protein